MILISSLSCLNPPCGKALKNQVSKGFAPWVPGILIDFPSPIYGIGDKGVVSNNEDFHLS